jgi:hypothetical protein
MHADHKGISLLLQLRVGLWKDEPIALQHAQQEDRHHLNKKNVLLWQAIERQHRKLNASLQLC